MSTGPAQLLGRANTGTYNDVHSQRALGSLRTCAGRTQAAGSDALRFRRTAIPLLCGCWSSGAERREVVIRLEHRQDLACDPSVDS